MPAAAGIYYAQSEATPSDAPAVVLLHGAGGDHTLWPSALRRMSGQRVFAIDLPGHGRSDGVGLQSIAAYADRVLAFLETVNVYQAVLIGHDMGGAIALELAIQQPARVAGLGLIGSGAYLGITPDLLQGFANLINMPVALDAFRKRAFTAATPTAVVDQCMRVMQTTRPSVTAADWYACSQFDRRADMGLVHAPAWIITGAEDHITPLAYAHFLSENLPAARLQAPNGIGHLAMLEAPTLVGQGIQQFLAALAAARRAAPVHFSPTVVSVSQPKPVHAKRKRGG